MRSLQRYLEDAGTTFSTLLNERYRIGRVASLFGYTQQASFTPWFSRRFGRTPGAPRGAPTPTPPDLLFHLRDTPGARRGEAVRTRVRDAPHTVQFQSVFRFRQLTAPVGLLLWSHTYQPEAMMRSNNKNLFLAGAALCAAFSSQAATLVKVSGDSPYGACGAAIGPVTGVNYVNAEVEPYLAVDTTDSTHFIGVWQQDRWSDGGARGLVSAYSNDSGGSWTPVPLPFSACATGGLNYERASDPWISIGPDGTAYAISISFNASNNNNAVGAATSTDGGKSWINLNTIIEDNAPGFQFFNDKESITADPIIAGTAYAVWDRLESPNANPQAVRHAAAFRGPAMFSKTTDGGKKWSTPKIIVNTPARQQTIGNQIVVDRQTGRLYNFFTFFTPPFKVTASKVAFVMSDDGGDTWSKPQIIADLRSVGVTNPNAPTTEPVRTGDDIPEVAIDAATGDLYVVWQDSRFNGGQYDEIALSRSSDNGKTWSAPIRVNTPSGRPAFNPSVQVSSSGTVAVTYYDFRNLAVDNKATLPTDYWLITSTNQGVSFGNEMLLTTPQQTGSFDMKKAPFAEGFFVGDYEGQPARADGFVPFFVKTTETAGNPTDVFVVKP